MTGRAARGFTAGRQVSAVCCCLAHALACPPTQPCLAVQRLGRTAHPPESSPPPSRSACRQLTALKVRHAPEQITAKRQHGAPESVPPSCSACWYITSFKYIGFSFLAAFLGPAAVGSGGGQAAGGVSRRPVRQQAGHQLHARLHWHHRGTGSAPAKTPFPAHTPPLPSLQNPRPTSILPLVVAAAVKLGVWLVDGRVASADLHHRLENLGLHGGDGWDKQRQLSSQACEAPRPCTGLTSTPDDAGRRT